MRAICEACSHPQPPDWKPGDLCIDCGQPVQREVRCFWCARWTPAGKYCRRCGAAVLEEALYGAARMLRDAGTDRFTIPKLIVDLDPEQIDNFTRIYQRHAATMHRHVDQVRFLEDFLHQHHWSEALEEELIAQLPWPDEQLEKFSAAMGPEVPAVAENLPIVCAIQATTPFVTTRSLAALVRLLLDDWTAQREAQDIFRSQDLALRNEAALALTTWRVIYGPGIEDGYRELVQALRTSPFRTAAAVRLALLGDKECELPAGALLSADPDVRFTAALATCHLDTLIAALGRDDELERFAAATRLIGVDVFSPLGDTIRTASPGYQLRLLKDLAMRAKPAPDLRETLYEVCDATSSTDIRRAAVRVLCYGCPPGEVERLAGAASGESAAYQAILQTAGLPPESLVRLGFFFLKRGVFRASQYGMNDIARHDRMPPDFVPRHWEMADDKARIELCAFAECQLEQYADEDLHRFLVGVAFGTAGVPVRATVWTALHRWYRHLDVSDTGQILIQAAAIERFFGTVPAFLSVFTQFLKDPALSDLLRQGSLYERIARLLRYADPNVLPTFATQPAAVLALADAVMEIAQNQSGFDFILRIECVAFLGWLGRAPEFRGKMKALIETFKGTDMDHASNNALERLAAV